MATKVQESTPIRVTTKELALMVGGLAVGTVAGVDATSMNSRIRDELNTTYPPLFEQNVQVEDQLIIGQFNEANGQRVRRGELSIEIPTAVAQRLQVAYQRQDQEIDRLRRRQVLNGQLAKKEQAFDLNPNTFNIGRSSRSFGIAIAGLAVTVATLWRGASRGQKLP